MLHLKENKGITMITLVIMIIIIFILAGISLTEGKSMLKKTKVENIITNMITIRAKSKVYAEEVNAEVWDVEDKNSERQILYLEKYNMPKPSNEAELISKIGNTVNDWECYEITKETLTKMGLENLVEETNNGDYVVAYDSEDYTNLDIIYKQGVQYNEKTYYTLSSLQAEIGE